MAVFTDVSVVCTHFPSFTPRRFTQVRAQMEMSATTRCHDSPNSNVVPPRVMSTASSQRSAVTAGKSTPRNLPNATATAAMVPVWMTMKSVHP